MKFIFSKILLVALLAWPKNSLATAHRVNDTEPIDSQLVVVYRSHQQSDVCGGVLVSPKIVITAAHCFYDPQRFPHLFGVTHIQEGSLRASLLVAHPGYKENGRHNDIGALQLERPVCERCLLPVGQSIPMALWTRDDAKLEMMVFFTNDHLPGVGTKRIPVRWTSQSTCQAAYHRWGVHLSAQQVCVESLDPEFSNRGESAILLVNGQPIGVLSYKLDVSSTSPPPYVYTDLTRYPDFIAREIRSDAAYRICSSILYVVISLGIVE